ncbi:hypothetical protein W822_01595 [Advenella kashmirensis W13003]|uniref:HTH lysR-type domain-containing protein n=2 Tax=Advenella kashmirensis TaxID=310575 RepID=V8R063_9BURK|nr:hypothetical protein W822_01595 [Advenella kashmirensis W13003]
MSPATLSRRLANLEFELGQLLFARSPTGYALTKEGRVLLESCTSIENGFSALSSSLEAAAEEPTGTVRVATSENIANLILLPRLPNFLARYPLINIDFQTDVQPVPLHAREADLAVRVSMPERGPFKVRTLGTLRHALYLSGEIISDGQEINLGVIGWSENCQSLPIARAAMAHRYWRESSVRVSSLKGQVAAAQAGLGYAYLPCLVGDHTPGLVRIDGPENYLSQDIYLILHDDSIEVPRIRAVANFIRDSLHETKDMLAGSIIGMGSDA